MAKLKLNSIGKKFDDIPALQDINCTIEDGEFVALLGPSGCGKSTLLRLLAGFDHPTEGNIEIGNREVANAQTGRSIPPEDRNIGFVFQSYAIWPHMNVHRNVGYPLEVRGLGKKERIKQINAALEITGLDRFADRMPSELSGGQRQRVALARCLVSDPTAVLLDEPLANLDVALRASMQHVFLDFHRRTGSTMVYVTHDQAEAMAMADRIAVISEGHITQFDKPEALYNHPRSRFVAEFIGAGCVIPISESTKNGTGFEATILGKRIKVDSQDHTPTLACLRPENISIVETGDLRTKIEHVTYLGGRYRLGLLTPCGEQLTAETHTRYQPGTQIGITISNPWAFSEATEQQS